MNLKIPAIRRRWAFAAAAAVAVLLIAVRVWHGGAARAQADSAAIPTVAVVRVVHQGMFKAISVAAEFRPYAEVDVHAKVAGYVKEMKVDIGDHVKAGQLLALLEVPELRDDLDHASASLRRAQADYQDAHLAYSRLVAVNKDHPNLIAQQDLDTAQAHEAIAEGSLGAARADVEKYQTLAGYARIVAPFAGVITKRYADPGSLIQAGTASNTQAMPLVRVSDNSVLRLDFPVSVDYVHGVHLDAPVSIRVDSLGGQVLQGRIARIADKVDDATRTMVVELEVPNPDAQLVPGMYATVTLRTDERPAALVIPVEAVASGGKRVFVVNAAHRLEERAVQLGLETPGRFEVLSGLAEGELVLIGNPGQLATGQRVEPRLTAPLVHE
ncbi:MAG TPA: efflux RND transporter periplasmic adaptor subunit [Steroidobacteraceae bacterium]|jgi:RND family efflux transporter MFP subunit